MKIGISVPFDYFTDIPQSEAALMLRRKIGVSTYFLGKLYDYNVNFIELRGVNYNIPGNIIKDICRKLWTTEFSISIHTSLPNIVLDQNNDLNFSFFKQIVKQINNFQDILTLVIHSYSAKSCSYSNLLKKSVYNINLIAEILDSKKLPANFAIELNRGSIEESPGTTYNGLLELKNKIYSEKVGFCWDIGHAYSNALKNTIPINPPEEFVKKVIHTHIHGVDNNDITHCPLTSNNLPLSDYIEPLINNHYKGIYNLEINPERLPEENALNTYFENINMIKNVLSFK